MRSLIMAEVEKRKRGRPKKDPNDTTKNSDKKPDRTKKFLTQEDAIRAKKQENRNLGQVSAIKQEVDDEIQSEFHNNLPEYIEKRKQQFSELLDKCKIDNNLIIDASTGKVAHYELTEMLSKPLIFGGVANSKISAYDISMFSDCYWDCAMRLYDLDNRKIPSLPQLCRLMGISMYTFVKYKNHNDPNISESVNMAYDRFVDFYTVKGLTGELEKITTIFTLKAQFGLRDNDAPQMIVNNNFTTEVHTNLDDIEKQYGLVGGKPVIDVEV